ncbi:hypothetical protein OAV88_00020 [bacterium]|nr:hypothetical protein [bacterium]
MKQLSCDAKLKETTASALPSIDRIAIPSVSFKIDDRGRKYAVYVIRVECSNDEDYVVQRRFREFCSLHERLEQKYPEISLRDLNLRLPRKIMGTYSFILLTHSLKYPLTLSLLYTGQIMGQFSKRMLSLRRKALMEYLTTLSSVQIRGKQLEDLQEFLDLRHHIQNETSSSSVPLHHHHHHHHTRERSSSDNNSNTSLTKLTVPTKMTYDVSRICEGKDFESTMQNILHGAVGSESQKLRDYVRKFTNAWQQHRQQKPQLNNNSNDLKFFESTRNFVSVLSSDISKRFEPSLSRAIQNDSNNKDLLEDAVYRVVESAIMKQIGSQLETIAMTFVAEQDMKTLAWIDVLQRGGLPLPIKSDLFGIRTCFQSSKTWYRDAIEILNSLDKISLPSDMLRAIMRFTESILMEAREVSNGVEHVTADDLVCMFECKARKHCSLSIYLSLFLSLSHTHTHTCLTHFSQVPIMIYAVASSSLEHPHTTLMLIRHLSSPNLCRGEAEYYLTVFESVLFYLSSGVKEGDAVDSSTNKINDAIVDLRTPRRVQSRRLLGALSFDLNVEIKSFEQNPLRVWVSLCVCVCLCSCFFFFE